MIISIGWYYRVYGMRWSHSSRFLGQRDTNLFVESIPPPFGTDHTRYKMICTHGGERETLIDRPHG